MAILTIASRNAMLDAFLDLIDGGTTDATGDLVIRDASDIAVATLNFSNPAFPAASAGSATANAIASDTNAAGGTANDFIIQDRDNVELLEGTVGTSNAQLVLSTLVIGVGETVQVSSFVITQPAS